MKLRRVSILQFDTQYLAHPAVLRDEAKEIQKRLEKLGIKVLNPFARQIDDPIQWWSEEHSPEDCARVVERDLQWIRECDAVFAYVPKLNLCGTAMEIFYAAKVLEKPVFIYTEPQYRFHPWLTYYGQVFTDLEFMFECLELRRKLEGCSFRLAIGGKMGTGKSTIADFLVKTFQFKRYSFAAKLKQEARELFDMTGKDRELLQTFGSKLRELKKDVWANYVMKQIRIEKPSRVVIDDMRFVNEADILMKNGFVLVCLYASSESMSERKVVGSEFSSHPSETEIDGIIPDYALDTGCSIQTCYRKTMEVMVDIKERFDRRLPDE